MSRYVPKNIANELKKIDLLTYFKNYDPNAIYHSSGNEYRLKSQHSLTISNGFWNYFKGGIGGKNAIDFLIKYKGLNYIDALNFLIEKTKISSPVYVIETYKAKPKELILPDKNINNNRVISYLKSRGIDEEIIDYCIKNNLIYEEQHYHNVVFLGYDDNKIPKYAGMRATNDTSFKNDVAGSSKEYSFRLESINKTDTICVFESVIDALSYATFCKIYGVNWKNFTLISLAGVYQPAKIINESKVPLAIENYLKKHTEITKIILCLDNDEAGRNASKALKIVLENRYEVIDKPPKLNKDYNEYLCNFLKNNNKIILKGEKNYEKV